MADDEGPFARSFLSGGGACGALIAERDWSATPLGPIAGWPQSLRTATAILLRSHVPMVMLWGEQGVMLYNDGYAVFAGKRHPALLGCNVREGWPEVADFNDNVMRVGLAGGTLAYRDQELTLYRNGVAEQVWMDLDYSPVLGETGRPAGVLAIVVETTERVRAERELREAGEQADARAAERAAMLGQLAEGVILTDAAGQITFVNEAAERIHGVKLLGVAPDDYAESYSLLTEDGRPHPPLELPLARAVRGGETVIDARWRIRRPDGTEVLAIGSAQPFHDAAGAQIGAVLTLRDDTERSRAEAALRASEARLRAVIDAAPVGLVFAGAHGHITGGNAQMERIVGHPVLPSPDIASYREWLGFHPDGRRVEGHEYPLARALAGEERPELEVLYQRGDGRMTWLRFVAAGKRDADGRITGAVVAVLDIDAERRAQDELRRLNAELEARVANALAERRVLAEIVESTDAEIQVLDPELRFLAINAAAAAGYARLYRIEPKVGDRLPDLLPTPEERERATAVWARALTGEEFAVEAEWGDAGLERRWFDMRFRALRRDDGEVSAAYLIGYDVTEDVRNRERLAQAEDALRQAQKMEAVGQLTGGIAHDFNNLLGAVVGSLDLIRRRPDDLERVKRYAGAGLQAAERGAKLTGQLLAFSRAQRIELKPLLLGELVDGMRDMLARTLGPMVRLRVELDGGSAPVLSDPTQLEMAVLNLAINARDAMPDGGDLSIATAPRRIADDAELEAGEYVELTVADTGAGMPADVLARAFDPFFTTKGVGKGTGLGLSQVYGIARQAGGAVRIESRVGEGTTVTILLPRTDAPVRAAPDADGGAGEEPARRATVLVVDDDPDVRRVLVESLDALGYRVVEAADGPAGLDALDREPPDVLMVDFAMPGMNGAEVARAARERRPGLPVVFASGYADTAAIEGVAGPDAPVLRKPFRVADLQAVLASVLGGGEA